MAKIRSLFVSDVHMGSSYSRSDLLLEWLTQYQYDYLYLVGDFIDGWKFRRGFYWPESASESVKCVLNASRKATVRYCIGNHDEFLRRIAPVELEEVIIAERFEHVAADGRRFVIRHGDWLDTTVCNFAWAAHLGDRVLSAALWMAHLHQKIQSRFRIRYWSFANYMRRKAVAALAKAGNFEGLIAKQSRNEGYDGVVCGHIHMPKIDVIGGTEYYNCGDWVENGTAIIEHLDGKMELIRHPNFPRFAAPIGGGFDWPG